MILVVERDRLLRWALYETLVAAGFRVLTAPEGVSAAASIHQIDQPVSLAFVDDLSWPLTASARAAIDERWPGLPIVVMLHADDDHAEERARACGAAEVLAKPFDLVEVVRLAARLTEPQHISALP